MTSKLIQRVVKRAYGYRDEYPDYYDDPAAAEAELVADPNQDYAEGEFQKEGNNLIKKLLVAFKKIGWSVKYKPNRLGVQFDDWYDDRLSLFFEFGLSIKGGQTLKVKGKKITADGSYEYELEGIVIGGESTETDRDQETEEYWSGRYDDYEPSHRYYWVEWDVINSDVDFFAFDPAPGDPPILFKEHSPKDVAKFAEIWTQQFFALKSRSKWKKRGAWKPPIHGIRETVKKLSQFVRKVDWTKRLKIEHYMDFDRFGLDADWLVSETGGKYWYDENDSYAVQDQKQRSFNHAVHLFAEKRGVYGPNADVTPDGTRRTYS